MHHQPLFLKCNCLSYVLCYKQALDFYTAQKDSRGSKEAKAILPWHSIFRTTSNSIAAPIRESSLPTIHQIHGSCIPAGKVLQAQRNHSNAERQYICL